MKKNHYHLSNKLELYGIVFNSRLNIEGRNNAIYIEQGSILKNCDIKIFGNNNTICIKNNCYLLQCKFWIEDNNGEILIGAGTTVSGKSHFACIEGTKIILGNDCMLSSNITFRTGDSHSIIDMQNKRINPSENIVIGDHVWIGNQVIINKGVKISNNSIIGTGAIVTKQFESVNIIIAGNPAKIIKSGINWKRERL